MPMIVFQRRASEQQLLPPRVDAGRLLHAVFVPKADLARAGGDLDRATVELLHVQHGLENGERGGGSQPREARCAVSAVL